MKERQIEQLRRRVAEGGDEGDARALAAGGAEAVGAVLRASERGAPEGRDFRDWEGDLGQILARIAEVDPTPILAELEARPEHARKLLWALGGSEHERAVAALLEALSHRKAEIRWVAVHGLAKNRARPVVTALADRMVNDRSTKVRFAALEALSSFEDLSVLGPLEEFLDRRAHLAGEVRIASKAIERILRKT